MASLHLDGKGSPCSHDAGGSAFGGRGEAVSTQGRPGGVVGPSLSLQRRDAHMVVGLSQAAQPCTFSHVCAVPSRNDWSIVGEDDVSLHLSVSSPVGCKPVWKRESCKVSLAEVGVGVGWGGPGSQPSQLHVAPVVLEDQA